MVRLLTRRSIIATPIQGADATEVIVKANGNTELYLGFRIERTLISLSFSAPISGKFGAKISILFCLDSAEMQPHRMGDHRRRKAVALER